MDDEDRQLLNEINNKRDLTFLTRPEFAQAYQPKEWLNEFEDPDEILELVGDMANSELIRI